MNIILVYKKTLKEIFLTDRSSTKKKIEKDKALCTCILRTDQEYRKALASVEDILHEEGLQYKKIYRGNLSGMHNTDLVIVVGGDGTFLNAAHHLNAQAFLLVNANPKDSEAFYSGATRKDFRQKLRSHLAHNLPGTSIYRLKLVKDKKEVRMRAVNDILIAHQIPSAVTRYVISVNGKREEQKSSGIWIATPGGSTAAIHSAGGKILPISSKKIQYLVREPYKRKEYQMLHGITTKIAIYSKTRRCRIFIDGRHDSIDLNVSERLDITLDDKPLFVLGFDKNKNKRYI
ncbi:MAG: hypothetical protein ABIJ21_06275 [Nanoarchaeota archaeon]